MNSSRRLAMRLALYLDCIGVKPVVTGGSYREFCSALLSQFLSMDIELRKQGRRSGRQVIDRAHGLEKAAGNLIPLPPPTPPASGKWQRHYEHSRRKILLWPPETPPCPVCRMWGGLPKRSWPSRERAEAVRVGQNESTLRVYACPAQPGVWHLGHRKDKSTKQEGELPDCAVG